MNQSNTERVRGKWIKQNPMVDTEECSVCGYNILDEELETPFCPWCGSDMQGENNMDDVIYRQDAVNELREYITEPSISDDESEIKGYNDGIELSISVLSTTPSAQKKGHWMFKPIFPNDTSEFPMGYLECSECGSKHANATPCNFCDNCGADMRGDEDG